LKQIANRLRHHVLHMTTRAGSGHPTTCLSSAELMACLFFSEMKYNVNNPQDLANDEFVLSKGHAAPILWAAYTEAGIVPFQDLSKFRTFSSSLEGHPTPRMPWVKVATGSLGQGLSAGIGMAIAQRLHNSPARTFVLMGDGECAEGSVWEAASLAQKQQLSNLVAIIDVNRLGQSGESLHGKHADVWKKKFESFGWNTLVVDGHHVPSILAAFKHFQTLKCPSVLIAKTIKGRGVSFLEDKEGWHGKALSPVELIDALRELGSIPSVDAKKLVQHPKKSIKQTASWITVPQIHYKLGEQVATREAYGSMLAKLGKYSRIVVLDGDVKNSTFAEKFKAIYPRRFVDSFIAEQNMVGMAMGLAAKGLIPFASTFAAFLTRAHDQLRMAAISRLNLKCVGSHAGVSIGEDGPSQMGLEDIALFRSLPESVVLYPCDAVSAENCTALLAQSKGVGYLRTTRPKTSVIYKSTDSFNIGGSKLLVRGKDVLIIAAGITVHESLKAAQLLKQKGISASVLDAYSIKPLDAKTIRAQAKGKQVIVMEDHYAQGGLGEAVASLGIPITHLCVKEIPRSGKADVLLAYYKIDADAICKAVKLN
ncbi:MAG TPA: transketolase, partial [Candidatus Nanoarchaeia archaeon]|nr:transketolase [Candidatus Nanoarchaeia archaeon]